MYNNAKALKENMVLKVVALLEKFGQSSRLHALSGEQLIQELKSAGVPAEVQEAILQQRARHLESLIGAQENVCCLVHAPQDEEPEDGEQQQEERHASIHTVSAQHGADRRVANAA